MLGKKQQSKKSSSLLMIGISTVMREKQSGGAGVKVQVSITTSFYQSFAVIWNYNHCAEIFFTMENICTLDFSDNTKIRVINS